MKRTAEIESCSTCIYRKLLFDKLTDVEQVELRITSAACRIELGQMDAAVVTLTCKELNLADAPWGNRLRSAYSAALIAANRGNETLPWGN